MDGDLVMPRLSTTGVLVMMQLMPSPFTGVTLIGTVVRPETLVPTALLFVQATDCRYFVSAEAEPAAIASFKT